MAKSKRIVKVDKSVRPITLTIKFLADCGIKGERQFKEGDVEELLAATATRWIKRGKAVRYEQPPKKKPGRPKKQAEPPKIEEPIEEKKIEDSLELPSSPPITVTDPIPEIEKA